MARNRSFSGLGSLLSDLEKSPSWQSRRQFRQVVDYWPKAVGHLVARQSKPVGIRDRMLYVSVANGSWAQTLTLERRRILHKLNQFLASPIADIRFSSARWHVKPTQPPTTPLLAAHPSYVELPPEALSDDQQGQSANAEAAYRRWAAAQRLQQQHQPLCPECACPCPQGELKRWNMCALCIAKTWSSSSQ